MMREVRGNILWIVLPAMLAMTLLLVACGGGGDRGEEAVPEGGEVLTGGEGDPDAEEVVFWIPSIFNEVDTESITGIVESFNEENPDIRVTMVRVPGDETDTAKLMTAVRGGVGPDVYLLDRFTVAQRAADGVLQDLGGFMEEGLADQYLEFAWSEVMFDGRPYALPFDTDVRALFYRKDLLEEAGVDPAELDPGNGLITIERLNEIAARVDETDNSGAYTRMGMVPWIDQGWHYTWGFVYGGEFFDPQSCEVTPTHPGVVEGFRFMYDWAEEKDPARVQAFVDTYVPPDNPPSQHPLITGRVAMMVGVDAFISLIDRYAPDLDYGITYIPVPEEGQEPATWSGGWALVIPEGAEQPEAAYRFMEYMAGEEGQRVYVRETQHLPTLERLLDEDEIYAESHIFLKELLPISNNRPPLPVGAQYWDELTAAQEAVTLNRQHPEAALESVANRVQPRLEQFCPLEVG
ncbi:ABC transporter substrate-binding protein [Rubrobacter taiwanensis]|jgi:multiple sugar transport system substrate-binding protein|uniref:ABC transporter substrate-binding protein n=1 Tax=Rubrobacter taiwanensis TaxID=185139 RepID=A0A4R1BI14_9ACTN|nr:ABC transporter substrate-binding protein [Rubrobacter taiwanensis]TCJ16900.1 ABC transporter substrate-binding protein [Rubrobacter taiwanensis]